MNNKMIKKCRCAFWIELQYETKKSYKLPVETYF